MSSQAARIRTGSGLALAAALLLWLDGLFAPGRLALVVVTLLALLGAWELGRMGSLASLRVAPKLVLATCGCGVLLALDLAGALELSGVEALAALYALTLVLAFPWIPSAPAAAASSGPERRPARQRLGLFLALWLIPPLFAIVLVDRDFGTRGLVVLIVLSKIGDNAGYFVGRAIGKRHPFPGLSPGKTVAGCVASLVAGMVVGALLLPRTLGSSDGLGWLVGAAVGALVNLAAQAGDLSESWVKRRAGVKDSSHLVGPAGGLLDVVDSLLLAAPVALVVWRWAYAPAGM